MREIYHLNTAFMWANKISFSSVNEKVSFSVLNYPKISAVLNSRPH